MVAWWVLLLLLLLLLLLSSSINHKFVSVSLGPSINILLSLYTCILPLLKTTVQSASHSTSTDINEQFISLNLCPFYTSAGSSGASCSYRVVSEFIVFVLATPTLIFSCCSSFPRYLCLLARNMLVATESGWPCGMFLLFSISLNLEVRIDRRVILSLYVFVTATAYDICLLLREDEV